MKHQVHYIPALTGIRSHIFFGNSLLKNLRPFKELLPKKFQKKIPKNFLEKILVAFMNTLLHQRYIIDFYYIHTNDVFSKLCELYFWVDLLYK